MGKRVGGALAGGQDVVDDDVAVDGQRQRLADADILQRGLPVSVMLTLK